MRYSLCMSVYNMAQWLESSVQDLLDQTFRDFELILVDDASTDGSGELCESLAGRDERIRVLHHERNMGLSASRNTAMQAAEGEYILFPDPDDGFERDLLACIEASLGKQPADLVVFGLEEDYYGENGELTLKNRILPDKEEILSDPDAIRRLAIGLENRTLFGYAWNKAYRRSLLQSLGVCFETVVMIEDVLFNLPVYDAVRSLNLIPQALYHYRIRTGGSLTKRYIPDFFELHERRVKTFLDYEKKWGTDDASARKALATLYCKYFLSALQRNCDRRSGLGLKGRMKWIREHLTAGFCDELMEEMNPDSRALSAAAACMKSGSAAGCLLLGRAAYTAQRFFPVLFARNKHRR